MFARHPKSVEEVREHLGHGVKGLAMGWELPPAHDAAVRHTLKVGDNRIRRGTLINVGDGHLYDGKTWWARVSLLDGAGVRIADDLYFTPEISEGVKDIDIAAQGLWHHLQGPDWEASVQLGERVEADYEHRRQVIIEAYEVITGEPYIPAVG